MKRPWKNHLPGPGYLFPALPLSVIAAPERKTYAPYQRSMIIMPTQPGRAFLGRNYADFPALGLSRSEFVTDPGGIRGSGPSGDGPGRYAEEQHLLLCPMRSNQNGGIENGHTMLRMILPKGTVFEPLTQWDIRKAVNHINSVPRGNLSGKTPYRAALKNMAPIYSRPGSLHSSFQMK